MTRSWTHRWRYAAIAGGILLLAVDCPRRTIVDKSFTSGDSLYITTHVKPVPQSGDEYPAPHTTPADSLGGPYKKGKPGVVTGTATMAAPVLLDTSVNDVTLSNYLNALNFDAARDNGELGLIRCHAGGATGCVATLYIQPEIGMKKRAATDIPATGMVVARIINYSTTETDTTYQIPPLTRAYWYVDKPLSGARSRLFIHTPLSANKLTFIGPTRTYEPCMHDPIGGPAQARFRKCPLYETSALPADPVIAPARNPFVRAVSFGAPPSPAEPATFGDVDGLLTTELWVKCAQGCCIAGP